MINPRDLRAYSDEGLINLQEQVERDANHAASYEKLSRSADGKFLKRELEWKLEQTLSLYSQIDPRDPDSHTNLAQCQTKEFVYREIINSISNVGLELESHNADILAIQEARMNKQAAEQHQGEFARPKEIASQ